MFPTAGPLGFPLGTASRMLVVKVDLRLTAINVKLRSGTFRTSAISEFSLLSGVKRKLDFEPAKGRFWREAVNLCILHSRAAFLAPKGQPLIPERMIRGGSMRIRSTHSKSCCSTR